MIDEEGYFYHLTEPAQEHGDPAAVEMELDAQVERALKAGIVPTHVDTHMGTVAHPKFMGIYVQLAMKYQLPADDLPPGRGRAGVPLAWSRNLPKWLPAFIQQLEGSGLPLLDVLGGMDLDTDENRLERTKQAFSDLQPGITHFIIHPSKDTPELRAITPDWRCRAADYQNFMNEELRQAHPEDRPARDRLPGLERTYARCIISNH